MADSFLLRVAHVSDKDLKVLRSLLGLASSKIQQDWEIATDGQDGDAVLVDVDDEEGAAHWSDLDEEGPPAVAYSRDREFPARLLLHKPIRSQQLIGLLGRLSVATDGKPEEGEWTHLEFGGDDAPLPLAEHLRRRNWDQPVLIGGGDLPELVVDSGAGVWYSSASDRELAILLRRNFPRSDARPLSSSELVEHTNGLEQQTLSNLKWRAGLALSSRSLHPDLADGVRLMMPQVPLQALSDTAYSRQARTLMKQPMTVEELVDAGGADRRDVIEFLNACHTCGFLLIDPGSRESASAAN
ncbi:MAG: hypothetical protein R3323_05765 [Wenzhouxiangellaceae bacterium]|nr:hypothetical protein [Wenzhouxiangellaceae bacterium]